jgi:hypothetical protein
LKPEDHVRGELVEQKLYGWYVTGWIARFEDDVHVPVFAMSTDICSNFKRSRSVIFGRNLLIAFKFT